MFEKDACSLMDRYVSIGKKMIAKKSLLACFLLLVSSASVFSEEFKFIEFRGVITLHNIPAKIIKVNEIDPNPLAGKSIISENSLLIEFDKDLQIMSNWSIVKFKYKKYDEPKIIKYELFGEEKEITIKYQAVDIKLDGDLSQFQKRMR